MHAAQELADVFDEISGSSDPNLRMDQYWAKKFQVPEDHPDLLLALSAMHMKLLHVRSAMACADIPDRAKNLYFSSLTHLEPYLNGFRVQQHSVSQLKQSNSQVDILHLAAAALGAALTPEVNDLTIEALERELLDLIKEIIESTIANDLKNHIIPPLETLLMAVRSYRSLGAEGIARVYGAAAAELARIDRAYSDAPPKAKSKILKALGLAKKAGAAIVWVGAVMSAASGAIEDGSSLLGLEDSNQANSPTHVENR